MKFIQDGNRFYSGEDKAHPLAEILFEEPGGGRLVVTHTYTAPELRGQGIARRLVERAADYAREKGYRLLAACPYARRVLAEEAFSDVYSDSAP